MTQSSLGDLVRRRSLGPLQALVELRPERLVKVLLPLLNRARSRGEVEVTRVLGKGHQLVAIIFEAHPDPNIEIGIAGDIEMAGLGWLRKTSPP